MPFEIGQMRKSVVLLALAIMLAVNTLGQAQPTDPAGRPPIIYSIQARSSASASKVTIVGFGFASSNTAHIGNRSFYGVPIAWQAGIACVMRQPHCHSGINQALVVTVPGGLATGPYGVSVENVNGVSNTVAISVPGAPRGDPH